MDKASKALTLTILALAIVLGGGNFSNHGAPRATATRKA